jgi:hypothetical protein
MHLNTRKQFVALSGASMSNFESETPLVVAALPQAADPMKDATAQSEQGNAEAALKAMASAATLAEWVNAGLRVDARDWSDLLRKSSDVNLPRMVLAEAAAPVMVASAATATLETGESGSTIRSAVGLSGIADSVVDRLTAGVFEARVINPELKATTVALAVGPSVPVVSDVRVLWEQLPTQARGAAAPEAAPVIEAGEPPVVEAVEPEVAAPVVAVPVVVEPVVEAPVTVEPDVVAPVVVTPVVEPVVEAPAVEAPVTVEPDVEDPVVEAVEPETVAPVAVTPVVVEPIVEGPFVETPEVEAAQPEVAVPVVVAPVVVEPEVVAPAVETPAMEIPPVEALAVEAVRPEIVAPVVVMPVVVEPVVEVPAVETPAVEAPAVETPVVEAAEPKVVAPVVVAPLTVEPEVETPVIEAVQPEAVAPVVVMPVVVEPVVEVPAVETPAVEAPVTTAPTYFYLHAFDPQSDSILLTLPGIGSMDDLVAKSAIYEEDGSTVFELADRSAVVVVTDTDLDTLKDTHFRFDASSAEPAASVIDGEVPAAEVFNFGLNSGQVQIGTFDVGIDTIMVSGDLLSSFEQLHDRATIYQDGHAAVIEFHNGHDLLSIAHMDVAELSASMFQFEVQQPEAESLVLSGTAEDDVMIFGSGNQTIDPGAGFDVVTGGVGADTFMFNTKSGHDFITDFVIGEDKIQIDQFLAADFDAMMDVASIYQDGGSTQVEFAGGQMITLYGIEASRVTQDSFVFV